MRRLCLTLACLATTLCGPSWATAGDLETAQQIVNVMERSGALEDYDVSVRVNQRTAYLRGTVSNKQQMATAEQIAQASPDIDRVINEIQIVGPEGAEATASTRSEKKQPVARLTNMTEQDAAKAPAAPVPTFVAQSNSRQATAAPQAGKSAGQMPVPARLAQAPSARMMNQGAAIAAQRSMGPGGMPQPAYVPGAGVGPRAAYDQPSQPGYAWPTYAAYPNYAALTYPKQYSATAWPYIGPFYPYPQVPLGWRKVTLEWDDGWWFLDFKD
jgi:hypothetical protein